MRVYVSSLSPSIAPQILAYAEYRLFAVLARYAGVRSAQVVLQEEPEGLRCSVTIDFDGTASARTRANGPRPAGTIDRAAELVAVLMGRHVEREIAAASN
jgi:hypothetical protein